MTLAGTTVVTGIELVWTIPAEENVLHEVLSVFVVHSVTVLGGAGAAVVEIAATVIRVDVGRAVVTIADELTVLPAEDHVLYVVDSVLVV